MKWLLKHDLLHPTQREKAEQIASEKFAFPPDIIEVIGKDKAAWKNYSGFSDTYRRIRIAYIDSARVRPDEFEKRLKNFIEKTAKNRQIGYGGIEKYC